MKNDDPNNNEVVLGEALEIALKMRSEK